MKSFLKIKSVDSGMAQLLNTFCMQKNIKSPVNRIYNVNDRIPFEQWLKELKYIDQQYKQEALGLEIAKYANSSHVSICTYIAMSCQNLYEYLNMALTYDRIWFDYVDKKKFETNNEIIIFWNKPAYYDAGLYRRETEISEELQVAIYYKKILQITGTSIPIFNKVELIIPAPKIPRLYEEYFKCNVLFNANKTTIYFNSEVFKLPLRNPDRILLELLKLQADSQLKALPKDKSFIELVNKKILQAIQNQDPRIEVVAEYLGMSPRNFQTSLKQEGIKFQSLLNNVRSLLAKQYLLNQNLSISTISELLGYKEQTSFNRSFKNWTGEKPLRWRELNSSPLKSLE